MHCIGQQQLVLILLQVFPNSTVFSLKTFSHTFKIMRSCPNPHHTNFSNDLCVLLSFILQPLFQFVKRSRKLIPTCKHHLVLAHIKYMYFIQRLHHILQGWKTSKPSPKLQTMATPIRLLSTLPHDNSNHTDLRDIFPTSRSRTSLNEQVPIKGVPIGQKMVV